MAATKATTLCSLPIVRAWLGVADGSDDARIVRVADAISERVESYCNRLFVTRTVTDGYDGTGSPAMFLRDYPVVAMTSLSVKDSPVASPTPLTEGVDYDVDKRTGRVQLRTRRFPRGFQNVAAVYTAGWGAQDAPELPQDVVQAALDYMKLVWTELTTNAVAATSVSVGPSSFVLKPGIPWGIKQVLESWVRPSL